jgi:hypothetical protein
MEQKIDEGLKALLESGKEKGYLTYDQVNEYLPDDAVNPEKLDQLLVILEEQGIELIDDAEADERADTPAITDEELRSELDMNFLDDEDTRRTDDPVRMYLTQMGEIPLLKRDEEIALAKKIEVTRKRFRRKVLECDGALRQVVDTLRRVHSGELPFDRTVKVSLTENLEKDKILSRMPHNLRTLDHLMEQYPRGRATSLPSYHSHPQTQGRHPGRGAEHPDAEGPAAHAQARTDRDTHGGAGTADTVPAGLQTRPRGQGQSRERAGRPHAHDARRADHAGEARRADAQALQRV